MFLCNWIWVGIYPVKIVALDMNRTYQFTAVIERGGDAYVSLCPELDIESQGDSVEEAKQNLKEAVELFFEHASAEEVGNRLHSEVFITRLEVAVG
jgi:predicted RNase H-like HicB family nuclease